MRGQIGGGSRGKGSRRLPGRDGGAGKKAKRTAWREYVPSAVGLELALEPPTREFRFRLHSQEVPVKLKRLDAALSGLGVPFHIKSLGRSSQFFGILQSARFQLLVSERAGEVAREVLRELGAA